MIQVRIIVILVSLSIGQGLSAHSSASHRIGQPQWDDTLDHTLIESRLSFEPIGSTTSLSSFLAHKGRSVKASHAIRVVVLESGLIGIFKTGEYRYAEVAGYRLSKLLGFRLVPPTVFRTIDGVEGSLQLYIDAPDLASSSESKQLFKKVGDKTVTLMKLFCYVAGQWDTHRGNQIITKAQEKYYLALIDNSSMLHRSYSRYGGVTFVGKGEENDAVATPMSSEFPFDKAVTLSAHEKNLVKLFSPFITKSHIHRLSQTENITYLLWNHSLWIEWPLKKGCFRRYSDYYYRSTIDAFSSLTQEHLEEVWAELITVDPPYARELISLTLQRRDELLAHASRSGVMRED